MVPDIAGRLVTYGSPSDINGKKPSKSQLKPHMDELIEYIQNRGIKTVICVDSNIFSYLTKEKFEASLGQAFKSYISELEGVMIVPVLNAAVVSQQPNKKPLLSASLQTVAKVINGEYTDSTFKFETYEVVYEPSRARELLKEYYKLPMIAYDIETTGLDWNANEFITHGFAKDRYNAFIVVAHESLNPHATEINEIMKSFMKNYRGSLLVHNIAFELRWLTWKFAMESWDDYKNMYDFVNFRKWDDTRYLAYVNLNSTGRIPLGLKDLAKEEYGNWDIDIDVSDALNIDINKLAYYNAIDVSATWYLYEKYSKMARPEELKFYEETIKPFSNQFVKLMLTGYPVGMDTVLDVEKQLVGLRDEAMGEFVSNPYVKEAQLLIATKAAEKKNLTLKTIKKTPEDMMEPFNPGSSAQLRVLLYDVLQYEITKYTDSKAPSTDRDTLEKIRDEQCRDDTEKQLVEAIISLSLVSNIITTFITALKNGVQQGGDLDHFRVYGNLSLGSTVSFRPTANTPNLLNTPSDKSKYGKLFKTMFKPREGYLIAQVDYNALQNSTNCNLSKDINLTKIISEGRDGHAVHTYMYWKEEVTEIMEANGYPYEDTAEYFSRVKSLCSSLRDKSKGISFALMFGSGPGKIVELLKCSMEEAELIYRRYHTDLYPGVAEYARKVVLEARKNLEVKIGTDGLYLRCPDIKSTDSCVVGAVERSVVNATIQYYDMLTIRGLSRFQLEIEKQGFIGKVIPHGTIYDSIYMEVEDNVETIKWVNDTLIPILIEDYMEDQTVKLKANLDIGPSWSVHHELPNGASISEIMEVINKFKNV